MLFLRLPEASVYSENRILCSNVRGLARQLSDLTVASSQCIYYCALRLWSQICVTCRSSKFADLGALSCPGREGWLHMYEIVMEHCANQNLSAVVAKCCFLGFVVFSFNHNPDLYNQIFYCLRTSMAAVQAKDARASFLFVGDLNGHHQECWVPRPRTIMVLQPLISQLCLVAISWLSAEPII